VPDQDTIDLQHLRRFAKPKFLPNHVLGLRNVVKEMYIVPRAWESTPFAVMQAPSTTVWEYSVPAKSRMNNNRPQTLHLLICPTRHIALPELHALLMDLPPFCSSADSWAYPLEIKEVTVPLLAPTSPEQAEAWSRDYWPTFYRKTNPFGAHPTVIANAENEFHSPVPGCIGIEEAMKLAEQAGCETESRGYGNDPGCVILERVDDVTEVVAVAGDARLKPLPSETVVDGVQLSTGCNGNVMGHAVMRAIGMVGRKRLRVASIPVAKRAAKAEQGFKKAGLDHDENARDAFFLDLPINALEEGYFQRDNLKPNGYLCLRLEVILTHEPCLMCSMALVHSRVGRVIFKHRMPQTGGLTAELASNDTGPVGLGYGLCWRKELNWQFMCWEYQKEQPKPVVVKNGNVEHLSNSIDTLHLNDDEHNKEANGNVKKSTRRENRGNSSDDDNRTDHGHGSDSHTEGMLYDDYANVSSFASSVHG
jgi:tRNA-specific adenosine deaminase 3